MTTTPKPIRTAEDLRRAGWISLRGPKRGFWHHPRQTPDYAIMFKGACRIANNAQQEKSDAE